MPELPEVQTVVNSLQPRLLGQLLVRVRLHRRDILQPAGTDLVRRLTDRTIVSIDRRGKRIVFKMDDGCRFYIHLGMTGQLTISPSGLDPLPPHTHLQIDLDSGAQLRFRDARRFGGIWWLGHSTEADHEMGPEPFTLRPGQLARRLSGTRRAVKTVLLDQKVLAGIGNIYADEALFAAGIDPLTPASDLESAQISDLSRAIKRTLRRAIRHGGSSLRDYVDANGSSGRYQDRHAVYAREKKPCRKCRTPIERVVLGGRSTHFCPKCQKPPKE